MASIVVRLEAVIYAEGDVPLQLRDANMTAIERVSAGAHIMMKELRLRVLNIFKEPLVHRRLKICVSPIKYRDKKRRAP